MSTIVEAAIPAEEFALHQTLEEGEGVEFEVVRVVEDGTDRAMPFLWATADDLAELSDLLQADPSTQNVETLTELDDELLVRMEWIAHIRVILYIILEENASILSAYGKGREWQFRILFPEHDSVSTTHDFCEEYDIDLTFDSIYELSESIRRGRYGLTEDQYETLLEAYEAGYYDIPRKTDLTDLAEDREISHQALSERIRRGHSELIETTLRPDPTDHD
ncbi:DNA-binding protein [Halorientalis sp. IM1011]|uniref:helix-turn-helix domain-containing protein n=1 Tax=Halorientalis sp. IM1011 TaxID=1932360 RepID=UPI00097CCEF3|nr:helix-turn-helix domain-containing protein [Halorientalis sp. IM1011]AQL42141.1 DNA-binding protein [Halorientalis sp. IM1011]